MWLQNIKAHYILLPPSCRVEPREAIVEEHLNRRGGRPGWGWGWVVVVVAGSLQESRTGLGPHKLRDPK